MWLVGAELIEKADELRTRAIRRKPLITRDDFLDEIIADLSCAARH